mgnify:CR=1 FL=1
MGMALSTAATKQERAEELAAARGVQAEAAAKQAEEAAKEVKHLTEMLRQLASVLGEIAGEHGIPLRWGGEEFLVFVPAAPAGQLDEIVRVTKLKKNEMVQKTYLGIE